MTNPPRRSTFLQERDKPKDGDMSSRNDKERDRGERRDRSRRESRQDVEATGTPEKLPVNSRPESGKQLSQNLVDVTSSNAFSRR